MISGQIKEVNPMIEMLLVLLVAVIFGLGYYIVYRFGRFAEIVEHARRRKSDFDDDDNERIKYIEYDQSLSEHLNKL